MPLTIHIDAKKPCYFGSETIRGRIIFEATTLTRLHDIRVTFTGRSKAKIQKVKGAGAPAGNYRSRCVLFEKEKILFLKNGEALVPGKYDWPFEFVFPTVVESSMKWPVKSPYRSDESYPLPPTFAIQADDEERRISCAIDYKIGAKVTSPQRGLFPSKTPLFSEEVRLNFMPDFAVSDDREQGQAAELYRQQKEQLFNIRSILLLPDNRGRRLSIGEKIQSWFAPGQLPKFSFTASLSYSTRVVQSTPLQCSLEITPHMEASSVTSGPEIFIKSISMIAISQTAARAAPSIKGAISAELDDKIEILSRTSLHIPVAASVDIGEVCGPLVLRHTDVSFRTFNICRTYRLCTSIVFECAGKTNEFRLVDLPFEVVAKVEGPEKKELAYQFPEPVEDAPPAYASSSAGSVRSM
ncbi:hypothetical protein BDW74DRAFT_189207 [Aspergillus multicolor]|uniref:uncharacterized protein n=1 Tax=Aspergillus multicolor TaxID=41759 RepID=UPI003CCE3633